MGCPPRYIITDIKQVTCTNYTDTTQAHARGPDSTPVHDIDNQGKNFPPAARNLRNDSYAGYDKVHESSNIARLPQARKRVDRSG